jgi:hypothetical protein
MAGYFNDGNGVKNITDGYFYDGDVKYYKDVVTTKYWKEITTTVKGDLEYACYKQDTDYGYYFYAKPPIGSDKTGYYAEGAPKVSSSSEFVYSIANYFTRISEDKAEVEAFGYPTTTYTRYYEDDLYIETTVTETVEGTPEDYTHTTTETTTVEVSADDEYDYKEYYPKKIKQIYKVINGEAKLIFNNE